MKNRLRGLFVTLSLLTLAPAPTQLHAQTAATGTTASATKVKKTAAAKPAPTEQEISDAKSKGMVWANLNTKVYHKSGDSTYGTTKNGKFMSEDDAKKAGFRQAKEGAVKKHSAATSTATAATATK